MKSNQMKKPPLIKPRYILAGFIILAAGMTVSLVRTLNTLSAAKAQAARLREQVETAAETGEKMRMMREFMQTDAYIERAARSEFGLSKPGTIRYAANINQDMPPSEAPLTEYGHTVEVFAAVNDWTNP